MEILSFGKNVKILEPKHFVKEMKTFCKELSEMY
jgi:predicted DNA-binding transcriptional regulator YafY